MGNFNGQEQVVIKPEEQRAFQAGLLCEEKNQVGKCFWKSCSFSLIEAWCTCGGMFVDVALWIRGSIKWQRQILYILEDIQ